MKPTNTTPEKLTKEERIERVFRATEEYYARVKSQPKKKQKKRTWGRR